MSTAPAPFRQAGVGETSGAPVRLKVAANGRVLIPRELRAAMEIGGDGIVTAWVENGELRLRSPATALSQVRATVKRLDTGRGSVVDEFIAEKRADASREDAEELERGRGGA